MQDVGNESCPSCSSGDIVGGSVDIEGEHARQRVYCCECGESWADIYRFCERYRSSQG